MGKGRSSAPAEQTVRQTQLPEYADPYFRRLLQGAEEATMPFYPDDPELYGDLAGQSTYVPYGGERIAPSEMYGDIMSSRAMTRGIAESGIAGMPEAMDAARFGMGYGQEALADLSGLANYQTGDFYGYQPTSMMDEFSAYDPTMVDPTSMMGEFQAYDVDPYAGFEAQSVDPYSGFQAADTGSFVDEFQGLQATDALGNIEAFSPTQFTGYQEAEYSPFSEFSEYDFRGPAEFSEFDFRPDYSFEQFQYSEPERFSGDVAQEYMSPYMEGVVESQIEAAERQAERQKAGRSAQAIQAGAFGGSRQAVQEALAGEALGRQVSDIQREGLQSAFESAAQQFERDRAAGMTQEERQAREAGRFQAATAAEQARVDQARYTELASREQAQAAEYARAGDQDAAEKARVQASKYQDLARIQEGKASEMGRVQAGMASENARMDLIGQQEAARTQSAILNEIARQDEFSRAEAARMQAGRVGELARAQGLTASELARIQQSEAAELARTQGISVDEARRIQQSEAAELARTQGISVDEAARIQAARAAERGRLDAFTAGEQGRYDALRASELARMQGARASEMGRLDALRASELARIQAAREASRQFGAGQGLAAYQAMMSGAGQYAGLGAGLASLGERQRAADIQGAQLLEAIGRDIRAEDQGRLDLAYEDFLRQRDYPISQYERMAGILRGVPVTPDVTQTRMASYNPVQQALGAGISALGLYRGLTG
jgi:hypothetical protein